MLGGVNFVGNNSGGKRFAEIQLHLYISHVTLLHSSEIQIQSFSINVYLILFAAIIIISFLFFLNPPHACR